MFEQSASTRRLSLVERERVVAPAVGDPVRIVEAYAQVVGLPLEPRRELLVAPGVPCHLDEPRFAS